MLKNNEGESQVRVEFEGFPFLGIWAKPKASYVCIEPWCGIADHKDHNGNIFEKEGVMVLEAGNRMEKSITMTFG